MTIVAAAGLLSCVNVHASVVGLPYYDGFAYAEGNLSTNGGPNWFFGSSSSTALEIAVSNTATLTAPAGFPAATGKGVRRVPGSSARRAMLQYTSIPAVDGNVLYVSFLLNVQTPPGGAQLIAHLDDTTSSDSSPYAGIFVDSGPKVGVGKNSSAPGFTMATNLGAGTHLVVARYTFQSGNDQVDLWVDPPSSQYGALSAPASLGSASGSGDAPSLDYLHIITPGSIGGSQFLDELRIGTAWADVVPGLAPPGVGAKLGFTTQPSTTQVNQPVTPAVVVQVQDTNGIAVASNGVPITVSLTSGSGVLTGTLTQSTDSSGKAVFNDLSIDTVGTGKQLTAIASGIGTGLSNAVSASFSITDTPVLTGLVITQSRMAPPGFVVDGHNDAASVFCQILGAIQSDAGTNWILVSFKNFDGSGAITFTNPVSPAMPNAFYRLRTGDTTTKIEAPSIGIPPQSLIVSAGATAVFTVTASGPLRQYLWYFNGNPIPGATADTLVITNAQAGNAGNYYVIVANPAGNVTSATATLSIGNVPPTIVHHPQDQTVTAGSTAIFTVNATGTAPLGYQWRFNTSTILTNETNPQLVLNNVSTNDAGQYSVVVTNAFGSATSSNATLTITPIPTDPPQTNLVGFAAGVTGGAGGSEVTATDYTAFRNYCRQTGPLIIHVEGALVANESYCYVDQPNKTIIGNSTNAMFFGDLRLNATNIIVANLYISSTNSNSDGITIDNSSSHGTGKYIWVDHCTFYNCSDGSLDVTKGADYVTVSWCKFFYAPVPPGVVNHEFVNLIASSDSDNASQYHVTFHHNWYSDYCRERMPSVRFGRVHVFNNYYTCSGNNYCVRTRIDAQVLVENNYYIGVQNPWERYVTTGTPGLLKATGNVTNNCAFVNGWTTGAVVIPGTDTLTDPSLTSGIYSYTLNTTTDVPYYVQTFAGSGKFPYVP